MKFYVYKTNDGECEIVSSLLEEVNTPKNMEVFEVTAEDLWYEIEAATFEEEKYIRPIRCGHTDQLNLGDPETCACGELYYPDPSGVCWKCGTNHNRG
jgi:hypothetical protein